MQVIKTLLTGLFGLLLCSAVAALVALPLTLLFLWGFGVMFEWVWSPDNEVWRWAVFGSYWFIATVFTVIALLRIGKEEDTIKAAIDKAAAAAQAESPQ